MFRDQPRRITPTTAIDSTYVSPVPTKDRAYSLTKTITIDLAAVAKALIVPGAINIRFEVRDQWDCICFEYDNTSYHISLSKEFGEYAKFKTNCEPYLLQDVLHSLHALPVGSSLKKDTLDKIIVSLSTTPFGIRELGVDDKAYRSNQRKLFAQSNDMASAALLEAREAYRKLPFVAEQMKLPFLFVIPKFSDDVDYHFRSRVTNYSLSFPPEDNEDQKEFKVRVADLADTNSISEYMERLMGASGGSMNDAKILEVGFGLGPYIFAMANYFQRSDIYGLEPDEALFRTFTSSLTVIHSRGKLQRDRFFQETVQEFAKKNKHHLGTFDFVTIGLIDIPLNTRDEAFAAMAALCKPTGKVAITCLDTHLADPECVADNRVSLLPTLFKHFGEVSRGTYKPNYQKHRFVFMCEKPKRPYQLQKMPHVSAYGSVQRYTVADWTSEKEALIVSLGGSFQYANEAQTAAYIWIATDKLKGKTNGGYREQFGLDRCRVREDSKSQAAKKMELLKKLFPQVTIEEDPEQLNSYLLTFRSDLRKKLDIYLKDTFEKNIIQAQAHVRGYQQRKKTLEPMKLFSTSMKALQAAVSRREFAQVPALSEAAQAAEEKFVASISAKK